MLNNFTNFYHNLDKKFKVIFWVAFIYLIFIIIILFFFFSYQINGGANHIHITNWNNVASDTPTGFQNSTERTISDILIKYNNMSEDTFTDAIIREPTYYATKPSSNNGEVKVSFIVDIESQQQSFEVKFTYNNNTKRGDSFPVTVTCPYMSDIKYTETNCVSSSSPANEVDKYLPYRGRLPSGASVAIDKRVYDSFQQHSGSYYLAISINSCDNPTIIQEGEDFIQNWLTERHLNYDDYYIEILNLCE